jgi:hypothetical protein
MIQKHWRGYIARRVVAQYMQYLFAQYGEELFD